MNESAPVTFNFFRNDNCTDFKFCKSQVLTVDQILYLLNISPEERLNELKEWMEHNHFGKSCEFYYAGDFYPCGKVDSKLNRMKEMRKVRLASEKIGK